MAREGYVTFPSLSWFEALQDVVSEDRELAIFGKWSTLGFALRVGERDFFVRVREGRIEGIVAEPDEGHCSFTLVGAPEDWETFLQETPPPFYHDLLAMNVQVPTFSIEADQHAFMQHIKTIKRIFRIAQSLGTRVG